MAVREGRRGHLVALLLILSNFLPITLSFSDADFLLQFKSTITDPKNVLTNWSRANDPCAGRVSRWTGVFCDDGGNVVKLVLENMGLSGVLNTDPLVGLKGLRSISFMNNEFRGSMPNVGQFVWLRTLYLSGNWLSGVIEDDGFVPMLAIGRVHLARNAFVGRIPTSLAGVERLTELMLDGNGFEGEIPEFQQLGLKVNFSNNDLRGPIPVALRKLDPSAFIGNKNLCGPPLKNQCVATAPPPVTQNSTRQPPASDSPFPQHNPPEPPNSTKLPKILIPFRAAIGILVALLTLAVLIAFLFIFLHRQRWLEEEILSRPPSKRRNAGSSLAAGRMEAPSPPHGACSGNVCPRRGRKGNEHGGLVFVRDGRGRFGIQDLLMASAELLGSGSFGSSYKAVLPNGSAVVVKRFKEMNAVGREDFSEHMRRLGRLSHTNLIPLLAYHYRKEEKLLVFDYIRNGSLAHALHGSQGPNGLKLNWPARLKIIKGIAKGIACLHNELPILHLSHGHLKSSNVLLGQNHEPLLTDYGLTPVTNKAHVAQIMVAYKAPEVVRSGQVTNKADVWSLGIVILEILTGKFPASSLFQGNGCPDMTGWVRSIVEPAINGQLEFDKQMGETTKFEEIEMMKLLQIGRLCCEPDEDKRLDFIKAIKKIEEVREADLAEEYCSFVSESGQDDICLPRNV